MKILEKEIELREVTRSVEQARPALSEKEFQEEGLSLAETQDDLGLRTIKVVEDIQALENAKSFGKEIQLLSKVAEVMDDARMILAKPNTGPNAIAAETEAIELLLQTKRINPQGGGGGGSSPGGGGQGTTDQSALALLGDGSEKKATTEDRQIDQSTGVTGRKLPEEYQKGLDSFFNAIEEANAPGG